MHAMHALHSKFIVAFAFSPFSFATPWYSFTFSLALHLSRISHSLILHLYSVLLTPSFVCLLSRSLAHASSFT